MLLQSKAWTAKQEQPDVSREPSRLENAERMLKWDDGLTTEPTIQSVMIPFLLLKMLLMIPKCDSVIGEDRVYLKMSAKTTLR